MAKRDLRQGTLALMVLKTLEVLGPLHGYGLAGKGPAGAAVTLNLPGDRKVGGELLAVEDSTLLLLEERQLVRVDIAAIKSLRGPSISTRILSDEMRGRLRLISRYPQGVPPELEAALLQAYGGTEVRRLP